MGKNHKLKKKLKSERAKVHIKSKTKFLPKGQNVTDTSFKIKPIIIQEQLKQKDASQLLSKRKSTITELVAKLKHYNDTVKAEACHELKEMIKTHSSEIIQTHLSSIIQAVSALIQDRERRVRKACVNVFKEILENVPTFKLEAFFNYILINMKCAMTNIDKNIQEDSLLLLDALLEHKPQLIADKFDKVFPDFLTLISKLRSQSAFERTLSLNLGSKLTSVKWRIKVLSRLYAILNAMIENSTDANSGDGVQLTSRGANESACIPIYRDLKQYEICTVNYFGQNNENKRQPFETQMNVLIPLLYETWVEAMPEEKTQKKDLSEATVLTEESAAVFSCVVNILRLLYEYSQINPIGDIFTSKEATKFLENLMSNFPYRQRKSNKSEFVKDFSKLFKPSFDPNCVEENLVITYLFITFKIGANNGNNRRKLGFITPYLNKCLNSQNYISGYNAKYLVKILDEILLKNPKLWHRFGVNNVEIMENVIEFYDQGKVPESCRGAFLEILTTSGGQFKYEKQQEWLGKLPNCLCEEQISEKLIKVILSLCRQNHQPTQETVKNSVREILDNLPTMKVNGTTDEEATALSIAYIFFYVPNLSRCDVRAIYNFIETHEYLEYSKHLRNMLDFKLNVFK